MAETETVIDSTQWRTVEIELTSSREFTDPFEEISVEAIFTAPDGRELVRPAFWDGGRQWKVRFAPDVPGRWSYTISVAGAEDSTLSETRGILACQGSTSPLSIYQHGFLRPSPNGPHLEHHDGNPFFWLGDTHWRFAWESWDDANKIGWSSQFRGTVDLRVRQGFSVYQTNLTSWGPAPYWRQGSPLTMPTLEYFQQVLDPRMAYIADSGLVNAVGLAWYQAVDQEPENLVRFARYIVARYGSYPIVWILGGEVSGYEQSERQRRLDAWRAVALAIQEADAYLHPITAHLTNERPIASYFQDEDWLSLTLNQLGHGDRELNPRYYTEFQNANPGKPIVEGETLYEGLTTMESVGRRTVTATMVRQAAYRAIQSGCCGYTYGAQGCWNGAWEYGDSASEWGDLPWYEGVDLPGAAHLGYLREMYESSNWSHLVPTPEAFTTDSWANTDFYLPTVSATADRSDVVVYFGETYRREGDAALVGMPDGTYDVDWFDPRTGERTVVHYGLITTDGRIPLPVKPDTDDWVLTAHRR